MRNVFYVGMPKTGSVSLHFALKKLGYVVHQDHTNFCCPFIEKLDRGERHADFPINQGVAALDFGAHQLDRFQKMDELYPGSQFISIRRPMNELVASALTHCLWTRKTGNGEWTQFNTEYYERIYKHHYPAMFNYFKNRPEDFLHLELSDVGWGPLCEFLKLPTPETPYPNVHRGSDKLAEICGGGFSPDCDWASSRFGHWEKLFADIAGKPLRMLEVGCFEGRSTLWWLRNILTHPDSRINCIDPWFDREVEKRFDINVALSGESWRVRKMKALSKNAINWIADNSLDLIYIDGSHEGRDVLTDALLSIHKLKIGGIMLFDDYKWCDPVLKRHHFPEPGIDAFLGLCDFEVEVTHRGYQVAVRKVEERAVKK